MRKGGKSLLKNASSGNGLIDGNVILSLLDMKQQNATDGFTILKVNEIWQNVIITEEK